MDSQIKSVFFTKERIQLAVFFQSSQAGQFFDITPRTKSFGGTAVKQDIQALLIGGRFRKQAVDPIDHRLTKTVDRLGTIQNNGQTGPERMR